MWITFLVIAGRVGKAISTFKIIVNILYLHVVFGLVVYLGRTNNIATHYLIYCKAFNLIKTDNINWTIYQLLSLIFSNFHFNLCRRPLLFIFCNSYFILSISGFCFFNYERINYLWANSYSFRYFFETLFCYLWVGPFLSTMVCCLGLAYLLKSFFTFLFFGETLCLPLNDFFAYLWNPLFFAKLDFFIFLFFGFCFIDLVISIDYHSMINCQMINYW